VGVRWLAFTHTQEDRRARDEKALLNSTVVEISGGFWDTAICVVRAVDGKLWELHATSVSWWLQERK
jgi:hypothetical protein